MNSMRELIKMEMRAFEEGSTETVSVNMGDQRIREESSRQNLATARAATSSDVRSLL